MITAEWFLHAFGATFENITVTRSYNKITLQFTQTSGTAGDDALGLCQSAIKTPSYFKTLTCKTSNYTNVYKVKTYIGGTTQQVLIVIPNCTTGDEHVSMAISKNEGSGSFFEAADVYCQAINTPVSIDISDCALYMGQFKNPPIVPSLDVNPLNQFMLANLNNFKSTLIGAIKISSATRYRILDISTTNTFSYGKFLLTKSYNNSVPKIWIIEFFYGKISSFSPVALLKANILTATGGGATESLTKVQITNDETNNKQYISISLPSQNNNYWYFAPITFGRAYATGSLPMYPILEENNTDTVLCEVTPTLGLPS